LQVQTVRDVRPGPTTSLIRIDSHRMESRSTDALLRRGNEFPHGALLLVQGEHLLFPVRRLADKLKANGLDWPIGVVLPDAEDGKLPLRVAAEVGSLAADGLLDAIVCPSADPKAPITEHAKTLLQSARLRTYRTEYISCPSCGRTLFDLQETTAR